MAITWNIYEARGAIQAQMDEANRLDGMIDTIAAERDALIQANAMLAADLGAAERERDKAINTAAQRCTELKRVRHALAAPSNSDLGDLIDALRTRAEATEADLLAVRTTLDGMIDTIAAERDAANAEVARLSHALGTWKQCGDAIMLCATGRAAPLSDWDDKGYAHVMAVFDRAAAAIIPQDPRCWADWVVYLLKALDANGKIETRGYDFYAVLRSLQDAINERKLNGRW